MKYSMTRKTSVWLLWIIIVIASCITVNDYISDLREQKLFQEAAKISGDSWDEKYKDMKIKDKYKVVYLTSVGGEHSAAKYFEYAAERLGWEVKIYNMTVKGKEDEIVAFNPDFIIATLFRTSDDSFVDTLAAYKKYYWISMPIRPLMRKGNWEKLLKTNKKIKYIVHSGSGMLSCPEEEIDVYRKMWNKFDKPFNGIKMLPLPPSNNYEPAEPKKLFWGGMNWDILRSQRYKKLITNLSDKFSIKVYGPYGKFSYLKPETYGGYIPPGIQNIEAIRKNGIYLITHSRIHINNNVPSMRPFEAAAANVITISDMHPFVMKHFGDSMLYFDHDASAEEIYKQVEKHMNWIMANPDKAKEIANRAHKIFLEKFTVDRDLIRIAKMHEYILEQDKKMNLEYPFSYGDICN